jgi:C_GCAxxG_C_C family probable redox protein
MRSIQDDVAEADRCWASGLNCAESVLRGACLAQGVELADQAKRTATPFGGGVGRSEDICGALMGGVLALGVCLGRTKPEEDRLKSYDAAGRLYKLFLERFGSTCCKMLNKGDFKSPEHRVRCGTYVSEATRLTIQVARENR